jgi:hypothetical protein
VAREEVDHLGFEFDEVASEGLQIGGKPVDVRLLGHAW